MNINLTIYDMENFLNKYTRFMTKDIYISYKMYSKFLEQYNYLFKILKKELFLYNDNKICIKVLDILNNKKRLLRLHNSKYFKKALTKYENFFSSLNLKLDNKNKMIILSEEENTYIIDEKKYSSLVVGRLLYLINYKSYNKDNILILVDDDVKLNQIKADCLNNNINMDIYSVKEYGYRYLNNDMLIDDRDKYNILIGYIINELFKDKIKFNFFYKAFSKYIYLNKDYKDYDTFKDYHNYMYKRKYLSSKLTLKKFNESEINKRKKYLRSINNDILKYKEEVDIANFLYLNSINYIYDSLNSIFRLNILNKEVIIKYFNKQEDKIQDNNSIYLYSEYNNNDNNYLSILAYELIKRGCSFEKIDEDVIYTKLCNTSIENYFSEFCNKYLVPLINYYEKNNSLDDVNMSLEMKDEFIKIYNFYNDYLMSNSLITYECLLRRIENNIDNSNYKYLYLVGDININCNIPIFKIVDEYYNNSLIRTNVKLLYDYKNYLYNNQCVPIRDVYIDKKELDVLTNNFLRGNINIINNFFNNTKKIIDIYEYDDSNRLHVYPNISNLCNSIIKEKSNEVLFAFKNIKDINVVLNNNNFTKLTKNTLLSSYDKRVDLSDISNINKLYDTIILPYLIKDSYHDELFVKDYFYNVKVLIYTALNKCKNNLIILVPSSKKEDIIKLLNKNNID